MSTALLIPPRIITIITIIMCWFPHFCCTMWSQRYRQTDRRHARSI